MACATKCNVGSHVNQQCSADSWNDLDCATCDVCNNTEGKKTPCDGTTYENKVCVSCDACGPGAYITNGCPSYQSNKQNCTTCPTTCSTGQYRSKNCTGQKMYDDSQCTLCGKCAVNEYIALECPMGNSDKDTHTCALCPDCSNFSATFPQGKIPTAVPCAPTAAT
jgi:hypothetical protein